MKRARWLILAPAFNCDGQAASQTVTDKIPFLERAGIQLEVIGGVSGARHGRLPHRQVWPWSPSGILFEFRRRTANRIGRGRRYRMQALAMAILLGPAILFERIVFGISSHWSWSPAAGLQAWRLCKKNPCDVIYSSGGPISAHLAGWFAHKLTGIPWIAEVHDPIVPSAPARGISWRGRFDREWFMERTLERLVCRDALVAWWFTNAALEAARARHPRLANRGFSVLPGATPPAVEERHVYGGSLNLGHFGKLSSTRSLHDFLHGLNAWLLRNPQARGVFRLHIYGDGMDALAKRDTDQLNLRDVIVCHGRLEFDPSTGESGRTQVTRQMQKCDALLLLHGNGAFCREYIPSKVYEYFWARRPILALTHENPQLDELVGSFGGIIPTGANPNDIADALDQIWRLWRDRSLETSGAKPIGVEQAVSTILEKIKKSNGNASLESVS